jgi:dTDP-4-amino-4,6-dideoxygalactose transaminase
MTEFSAALLLAQMSRLPDHVEIREQNAGMLTRTIGHIEGLESCERLPDATVVSWHVFGGRYLAEHWDGMPRGIFVKAMQAEGVQLGTGYDQPVYRETVFQQDWAKSEDIRPFAWAGEDWVQDYRSLNLPNVEAYCEERIGIRHAGLLIGEQAMKQVCDAFTKVSENRGELIAAWRAGQF